MNKVQDMELGRGEKRMRGSETEVELGGGEKRMRGSEQRQNELISKAKRAAAKTACSAVMRHQGPGRGPAAGPGALAGTLRQAPGPWPGPGAGLGALPWGPWARH